MSGGQCWQVVSLLFKVLGFLLRTLEPLLSSGRTVG